MLYEFWVKTVKKSVQMASAQVLRLPETQTIDHMRQPVKFSLLPTTGEVLEDTVAPFCDAEIRGTYKGTIFLIWHVPTAAIGSCIIFVRLQNTASQEASQGAKSKQGIVAQSISGWQSTVFCILYEYMQIYVWDVNKVHLSTIAEAWVGLLLITTNKTIILTVVLSALILLFMYLKSIWKDCSLIFSHSCRSKPTLLSFCRRKYSLNFLDIYCSSQKFIILLSQIFSSWILNDSVCLSLWHSDQVAMVYESLEWIMSKKCVAQNYCMGHRFCFILTIFMMLWLMTNM